MGTRPNIAIASTSLPRHRSANASSMNVGPRVISKNESDAGYLVVREIKDTGRRAPWSRIAVEIECSKHDEKSR